MAKLVKYNILFLVHWWHVCLSLGECFPFWFSESAETPIKQRIQIWFQRKASIIWATHTHFLQLKICNHTFMLVSQNIGHRIYRSAVKMRALKMARCLVNIIERWPFNYLMQWHHKCITQPTCLPAEPHEKWNVMDALYSSTRSISWVTVMGWLIKMQMCSFIRTTNIMSVLECDFCHGAFRVSSSCGCCF